MDSKEVRQLMIEGVVVIQEELWRSIVEQWKIQNRKGPW